MNYETMRGRNYERSKVHVEVAILKGSNPIVDTGVSTIIIIIFSIIFEVL